MTTLEVCGMMGFSHEHSHLTTLFIATLTSNLPQ